MMYKLWLHVCKYSTVYWCTVVVGNAVYGWTVVVCNWFMYCGWMCANKVLYCGCGLCYVMSDVLLWWVRLLCIQMTMAVCDDLWWFCSFVQILYVVYILWLGAMLLKCVFYAILYTDGLWLWAMLCAINCGLSYVDANGLQLFAMLFWWTVVGGYAVCWWAVFVCYNLCILMTVVVG